MSRDLTTTTRMTALVTGASAGIGRELAKLFAANKHDLVLVARRRDRLASLASELESVHGIVARVIVADLARPGAPDAIVAELGGAAVEVEFLVNNAGFGTAGRFVRRDLARELEMIQVNVMALVQLTGLLLPGMVTRGRGRILNLGSTAGFQPGPFMATYYATKAFVNSFTEALSYELRGTGVTATVSCPGATETEFAGISGNRRARLLRLGTLRADYVAAHAFAAMMAGKPLVVPGLRNKVGAQLVRVGSRGLVRAVTARLNQFPGAPRR